MSAVEIIEQIKSLPPAEREQVAAFIRETDAQGGEAGVRYMDKATFRAAKKRVFETHEELLRRLAQ